MNEFSKVAGSKINIQKLVAFLYTNNKLPEEIKKKIYLNLHQKEIKYLGINLTKEVKDLYSENYKTVERKKKLKKIQMQAYTMLMDRKNYHR